MITFAKKSSQLITTIIVVIFVLIFVMFYFNKKHESYCLNLAIQDANKYLQSKGFHETKDKSWQDIKGNYPSNILEKTNEKYMSNTYNKCIYFR